MSWKPSELIRDKKQPHHLPALLRVASYDIFFNGIISPLHNQYQSESMPLLSVQEAQQRILSRFTPVEAIYLPLTQAVGHILATEITASLPLPAFDNSAMDGFALLAADTASARPDVPCQLAVVADIPAGNQASTPIHTGEAARITTGAPLPRGADAIVPVEDTDIKERTPGRPIPGHVKIYKPVKPGTNVRPQGSDVQVGQQVLCAGRRLRSQEIGLLAMLGNAHVSVYRHPRLALLSCGDELVPVEAELTPGKVRDANTYTLSALIEESSGEVISLGIAADDPRAIQSSLDQAVEKHTDLIISSAGVSVGAFDFVKDVVMKHGSLDFWKVNMRPGKPFAFGEYHGIPFVGLPGNPVSAYIGFEVFIRPAIEKLSGLPPRARRRQRVHLAEAIETDGRETYLRAVVSEEDGIYTARLTGHQGSGNLLSLVQANALLIIPSGVKSLATGAEVAAWLFER